MAYRGNAADEMGASNELAPWASDIRVKKGKLSVTLRRGLDLNGVVTLLKTQDVSSIRALKIPGSIGLSGLRAIVNHRRFHSLSSVSINGFADADDAVDVILEAKPMKRLRVLKVWGVSDAIDMRLARGDFVDALRQLDIRNSPELTSLDRYFVSPRVSKLGFLTINNSPLADASELFNNSDAVALKTISLARCQFGTETVEALLTSKSAKQIKRLNFSYNTEDDVVSSINRLLRSKALVSLEVLTLCGCEIEGFDWQRVEFPSLRKLDLRDNPVTVDEFSEILEAPGLPKLQQLIVSSPEEPVPPRIDKRIVIDDRRPRF